MTFLSTRLEHSILVNECSKLFPVTSSYLLNLISNSGHVLDSIFHAILNEVELCFKEIHLSIINLSAQKSNYITVI